MSSRHGESSEIADLWASLSDPELELDIDPERLNYFQPEESWVARRKKKLGEEIGCILAALDGSSLQMKKVKCSRYLPSLQVATKARSSDLDSWLQTYVKIAGLTIVA